MPTSSQRDWVRYDLDVDSSAMPDSEVDDLYVRAEAKYSTNSDAVECFVRVLAIGRLLAGSGKRADYTANQSSEKLSQIFSNLFRLRGVYMDELAKAEGGDLINWGGLRRKPSHVEEFPDDKSSGYGDVNNAFTINLD